jgi:hypothetical protein
MKLSGFAALIKHAKTQRWIAFELAKLKGWPSPCAICWMDPDGYAGLGHVCNASDRRNHSLSSPHHSGMIVSYRAVSGAPMDDETLEKHLRHGNQRPKWIAKRYDRKHQP